MSKQTKPTQTRFVSVNPNKPGSSNYAMKKWYAPSQNIPVIDVIFDAATGKTREIRYIPGEKSIFTDEQHVKDFPKKRSEIIMYDGWKIVQAQETLLKEYLERCNFNQGNPERMPNTTVIFKEFKPEADAQINLDKEELDVKARAAVFNMKFEDMLVFAKAIGLNVDRDAAEIKHDLLQRAKKEPQNFLNELSSKNTKRKWAILEAVDTNIITINKKNSTVSWAGGNIIFQSALGADIVGDFAEYTQNTEDGKTIFERIQRLYDKRKNDEATDLSEEQILEKSIEAGIITKKGQWHYYKNEKLSVGVNMIYAKIKEDESFKTELLEKISIFEQQTV